jgi:16S rRNA (guanine966-N2)-methyltransferase
VTRVIAGAARGRRLSVPPGGRTRPTSDRAREGLFSTLESLGGTLAGRRVLDLYAGSGAVGLEALSRGARHVLLVESDARAARTVRANIEALGLPGAEVRAMPVERLAAERSAGAPPPDDATAAADAYDVVFADPPYDLVDDRLRGVVHVLAAGGWLAPGALVAVERATRGGEWRWPEGIEALRSRRYGEATLWYGRAAGPSPA